MGFPKRPFAKCPRCGYKFEYNELRELEREMREARKRLAKLKLGLSK